MREDANNLRRGWQPRGTPTADGSACRVDNEPGQCLTPRSFGPVGLTLCDLRTYRWEVADLQRPCLCALNDGPHCRCRRARSSSRSSAPDHGVLHEQAHLPAESSASQPYPRFPPPHAHPRWPGHLGRSASQGSRRALGLNVSTRVGSSAAFVGADAQPDRLRADRPRGARGSAHGRRARTRTPPQPGTQHADTDRGAHWTPLGRLCRPQGGRRCSGAQSGEATTTPPGPARARADAAGNPAGRAGSPRRRVLTPARRGSDVGLVPQSGQAGGALGARGSSRSDPIVKHVLIALIKAYRVAISPLYGNVCKYHPSCSAYGLRSVEVHGAIQGSWLTVRRIGRCHPWAAGGYDPRARNAGGRILGGRTGRIGTPDPRNGAVGWIDGPH